jgi:hypothetical protein
VRILVFAAALYASVAAAQTPPSAADAIQAMDRIRAAALADKARLAPLKRTEPGRYASEYSAVLARWEEALRPYGNVTQSVGARESLVNEYLQLGAFLRFDAARRDAALAAYASAQRARPPQTPDLPALALADIERFDKHDTRKALEHYRGVIASFEGARLSETEAVLATGFKRWLEQEIAFLERGQRFAGGALGRADAGTAQLWLMIGALEGPGARLDERALARLPASEFQIARHYAAVIELEPRTMLGFFAKHDPAGYLTAATFTLALYLQPSPYVKAAAQSFFASRGITGPGAKPDPRYATPEQTWTAFIAAAKKGDATAMLDCFTPTMQAKLGELFKRMSAAERRAMGESFVGFALQEATGEYREAAIVRQVKDKRLAGFVTFLNDAGAWKIESM